MIIPQMLHIILLILTIKSLWSYNANSKSTFEIKQRSGNMRKRIISSLLASVMAVSMIVPMNASAYTYSNYKTFNDKIVVGNDWTLIAGKNHITSRTYYGVTLSGLTSLDGNSNYTYLRTKIVNGNEMALTDEQVIQRNANATYRYDMKVTTSDTPYLSAKGNNPNLDARATGKFYAN